MADNLGPGSYNFLQLAIDTLISEMNDIEFQRLMNSEADQFMHMKLSHGIEDIQAYYGREIDLVKNEMKDLDKTSNEYFTLMLELQGLEDERDEKVQQIERLITDNQKRTETENAQLDTRYNAAKADKEGLEEAQDSNIKRS